jgi:deoxycytidylate deaminase
MKAVRWALKFKGRVPTQDETLMTMAYGVSKKSSCVQRKVGAVVAHIVQGVRPENIPDGEWNTYAHIGCQVVSSGWNDVPLGMQHCQSKFEGCFRDFLRAEQAKKLRNCPACGSRIPANVECPACKTDNSIESFFCSNPDCGRELLRDYKCANQNCGCAIFDIFLPGGQYAPGKLLDMCRALHAEENAIIGLSGIAKGSSGELVLYVTTFPCNQCANKIVASGIKKVVYADPYTKSDAKKVLDAGGIDVTKFEGVKGRAYFRLYD